MGRDVAGLHLDKNPGMINVKSNSTNHGAALVSPKGAPEIVETTHQESHDRTVNGTQDVLAVKSTDHEPKEKIIEAESKNPPDKKSRPSVELASGSIDNGLNEANSSEPVTPASRDGKQSRTGYTNEVETNGSGAKYSSQDEGDAHTPKGTNKSQPRSPFMSAKQHHSQYRKFYDEEDTWSLASSNATSVRTNKSKITVPVAPKFTVDNRLERRKEYYDKLEEKHKALQKERQEYEARIKEEEEAAIKQLRKNMVVRANPVPSFYQEGPPPKPELKKLPVTRPKSPNLTRNSTRNSTRRKSCGDAEDKGFNGRPTRHSVGVFRDGKYSPVTLKGKDRTGPRKSNETSKLKKPTETPKAKEIRDMDNAVES